MASPTNSTPTASSDANGSSGSKTSNASPFRRGGGAPLALPGFLSRRPRPNNNSINISLSKDSSGIHGLSISTPPNQGETPNLVNASPASQAAAVLRVTNSSMTTPPPKSARADPDRRAQRRRASAAALAELSGREVGEGDAAATSPGTTASGPTPSPSQLSYRHRQLAATMSAPVVGLPSLRQQCWNGVPAPLRADAWKTLLGVTPANSARRDAVLSRRRREYAAAVRTYWADGADGGGDMRRTPQEQETLRQILVDVPRTAPDVSLFREPRVATAMGRLLYIWAVKPPASSYVQGINDVATPLYVVFLDDVRRRFGYIEGGDDGGVEELDIEKLSTRGMPDRLLDQVEADTYHSLTSLLSGIQDHYTNDQPGIQRMVFKLRELVARIDPPLYEHLEQRGVDFIQFAFRWMNCLLLREVPVRVAVRMWDTYLAEGGASSSSSDGLPSSLDIHGASSSTGNTTYGFETFHVYVCAAFLCRFGSTIRTMEFEEMFGFLQKLPTSGWGDEDIEMILSQAFVLGTLFTGSDAHLTSGRP
mmetsp:Transcript_11242/g.22217  ORF Transcript_11242/g.22217 Transcript_11242/m.22217 type:complete len:536 (+) Transcript_11242:71-1678(+)